MKKNNPSIDTLVVITNRQLLKDDISLATYGEVVSRTIERLQQENKPVINNDQHNSMSTHIHKVSHCTLKKGFAANSFLTRSIDTLQGDNWMGNHTNLYTLCRDTDLPFEEYLHLCDTIGSTVVYHGKAITTRMQLETILHRQSRIHMPTNLIRHWQSEQEELWITLQQHFHDITVWSTVHNEDDIKLLASLGIPNLEHVLISPIFPTPCKEGHPGIGVKRGQNLLKQIQTHYPEVQGIALGGIHEHNYQQCLQNSFTGVAIMSNFMKQVHNHIDI